eukprot:symbB.v1.2.011071.t1/scaffold738.1/size167167/5
MVLVWVLARIWKDLLFAGRLGLPFFHLFPIRRTRAEAAMALSQSAFVLPTQASPALTILSILSQGQINAALRGGATSSELPSQAPGMQSAALGVTAVGAAFIVGRKGKGKKSLGLKASTQEVLFKGGAGTVDGGMGAGSFGGSKSTSSTSATVSASDLGVQAPTGYWDPLGLNAKADAATFNRRRAVEIKHGRDVLFKGGAGTVDGGMGAGSFGGSKSTSSTSATVSASDLGVQAPTGYWDPLGLNAKADAATFNRRRAVEIKHGRVAMYATMGYIVPEYYKFPGYLSPSLGLKFTDVPGGLAAISKVPVLGWLQILWFIGLIEGSGFFSGKYGLGYMKDATMSGTPGDYGVGFPTFLGKVSDPAAKKSKLNAELANGRLAMMAIIGMFFQDGLTGSAWGDWSNYTDSPLRASTQDVLFKGGAGTVDGGMGAGSFGGSKSTSSTSATVSASDLGVQAPTGYWDPLGLNAKADAATFNRRRAVEIKHGRVAMYATMGYIVPEYYKFPGYLSPSLGLKFTDVPGGLAAISKVPVLGWLQILWFIGLIEGSGFFSGKYGLGYMKDATMSGTPGDYGVGFPTFLGKVSDPTAKKSKLNAELANGRLAMMAIIGMFFQDGLTGSAWGDWSNYTDSPLRASNGRL